MQRKSQYFFMENSRLENNAQGKIGISLSAHPEKAKIVKQILILESWEWLEFSISIKWFTNLFCLSDQSNKVSGKCDKEISWHNKDADG